MTETLPLWTNQITRINQSPSTTSSSSSWSAARVAQVPPSSSSLSSGSPFSRRSTTSVSRPRAALASPPALTQSARTVRVWGDRCQSVGR